MTKTKAETETETEAGEGEGEGVGVGLPPIHRIVEPQMTHTSTRIRWFIGLGYTVAEVSRFLGVRYQQVRNVATTEPKRAAREDLPPFEVRVWDVDDDLEAMDKHALEGAMQAQRGERLKAARSRRRGFGEAVDVDGAELDDENYGR